MKQNRLPDLIRFADDFTDNRSFDEQWTNIIPGDDGPAGVSTVTLLNETETVPQTLPAAVASERRLKIIEGGTAGDK